MRLADLNPKLEGVLDEGILRFDCPLGHAHKIRVPVGRYGKEFGWAALGNFPDSLTLSPSIHAIMAEPAKPDDPEGKRECGWHGFIRDGAIVNA